MATAWQRMAARALSALVGLAMIVGAAPAAWAAQLLDPAPEDTYYLIDVAEGQRAVGVAARDAAGNNYYCIQAGMLADYQIGPTSQVSDDDNARRLAWLYDTYRNADTQTHAALGILTQNLFGTQPQDWQRHLEAVKAKYPGAVTRAEALWRESSEHAPASLKVERTDAVALRGGNVRVRVANSSGKSIAGVPYTVTLEGPARFANGKSSVSGVSGTRETSHAWRATGAGPVSVRTTYQRHTLTRMDSKQDFLTYGLSDNVGGEAVTFTVRKDFTPALSTVTSRKVVDAGEKVVDRVTSAVSGEDSVWVPGLELRARGYYFAGLSSARLDMRFEPKAGEGTAAFLSRLAANGLKPVAYGTAAFTDSGQSVDAQAVTEPGGKEPYLTDESGGFGTWVWAFERDDQSLEAQEYVLKDWTSAFGDASETNSNRAKVAVDSTVTEHSADVGASLSDTITVSGFPDDHGTFAGDEELGIGADRQYARVSVWWSGDMDDPSKDDDHRPSSKEPPVEDEHHRLIGTWEYRAVNGTFKVGAGAPDAHGEAVHITAENHGWYVFVWSFDGDDRVMPHTSRYDDAWETVRVGEPWVPEEPEKPQEPPQTPEERLPITGVGEMVAVAIGVMAAAAVVGVTMFAIIKRRSL
ncbi:cell surface protein [Bifidobacterium lemurum]|uniref:Cell surface protein n=2 Tax=Bifidobacterium lemurum TaxID=1603886 RepID=A0A261FVH9_9BIFI|nr:cell surface protein [Bifidobacterium lemurum]